MTDSWGKFRPTTMERDVYSHLGVASRKVIVGPAWGFDNAVILADAKRAMIITTDPLSIIPSVGLEASAWLSVHLIASDYTTSGLQPEFAAFTFNFPGDLGDDEVARYLRAVGRECGKLGVSIVSGHTGRYEGSSYTVVGGGSMFGFCGRHDYLDPSMARPGDAILMTKGAAIETTAMLAHAYPNYLRRKVGGRVTARAKRFLRYCSTVEDALTAGSAGTGKDGVSSMHDATEGGVLGALEEMAEASGTAMVVQKEAIHVAPEAAAVCKAFGINPLSSLSEGTLLLTSEVSRAEELVRRLRRKGIQAFIIGKVNRGRGLWTTERGGKQRRCMPPADRYWSAYARAKGAGLR